MIGQALYVHWRAVRLGLAPLMIAAFGLPLLAIQGAAAPSAEIGMEPSFYGAMLLNAVAKWLPLFPALAAITGITFALTAWSWDHETKHVYALSLPLTRSKYVLQKLGAGAALAAIPSVAFLAGTLVASAALALPDGLHAHPFALTVRFLLCTMLAYAVLFSLASGTIRTAVLILSAVVASLLIGDVTLRFIGAVTLNDVLRNASATRWLLEHLVTWPSPFHVLGGNWSLIDV